MSPHLANLLPSVRQCVPCLHEIIAKISTAMTWDKDAIYAQAKAVADEFYGRGYQVVNGPTSEPLGRTPWGGRLGEAFGPDAYQNGIVFGLSVKAYTDAGIIAGGKHFLLNEQETNRTTSSTGGGGGMGGGSGGGSSFGGNSTGNSTEGSAPTEGTSATTIPTGSTSTSSGNSSSFSTDSSSSDSSSSDEAPYSSNADDKTIHEAYLWPFYDAVKNGMGAVMCAMTEVNGSASCESEDLLMGLLKSE